MTIFSRTVCGKCAKISEMCGKCAENVRKTRKIPYCQVSHTHERTPGSVDRDPIVIWRPANDRTFAIPTLYGLLWQRRSTNQFERPVTSNSGPGGGGTSPSHPHKHRPTLPHCRAMAMRGHGGAHSLAAGCVPAPKSAPAWRACSGAQCAYLPLSLRRGGGLAVAGCCASLTQGRRTVSSLPPAPMDAQLGRLVSARPSAGGREGRDP